MVKHCIYCSAEIESNSVVDMCYKCMYQVWGEKMSKTIIENMQREKDTGNLDLGQVSSKQNSQEDIKETYSVSQSLPTSSTPEIEDLEIETL